MKATPGYFYIPLQNRYSANNFKLSLYLADDEKVTITSELVWVNGKGEVKTQDAVTAVFVDDKENRLDEITLEGEKNVVNIALDEITEYEPGFIPAISFRIKEEKEETGIQTDVQPALTIPLYLELTEEERKEIDVNVELNCPDLHKVNFFREEITCSYIVKNQSYAAVPVFSEVRQLTVPFMGNAYRSVLPIGPNYRMLPGEQIKGEAVFRFEDLSRSDFYTQASVTEGQKPIVLTSSKLEVFYVPWWIVLATVLVLVSLITAGVIFYRRWRVKRQEEELLQSIPLP